MFEGKSVLLLGAHPDNLINEWDNRNIMARYDTPEKRAKHAKEERERRLRLGDVHRAYRRADYQKHKEDNHRRARELRQKNRRLCIEHYSPLYLKPSCACCGITDYDFLTLDHIDNNGAEHRKRIGNGNLYSWLKMNNFPEGFQVLCYNCNSLKGHYGYCRVHQESTFRGE